MEKGNLEHCYGYPPFSVLDGRGGRWLARKKAWRDFGLTGEVGRGAIHNSLMTLPFKNSGDRPAWIDCSPFDPVLTELLYNWFCPKTGVILDPFAGGPVRGVVACLMGRRYIGIDVRPEQVEANQSQARSLCDGADPQPIWIVGDSVKIRDHTRVQADFVFSCPPYHDLERYSCQPDDLSTMPWDVFLGAYRHIIKQACRLLREDRFAAFVVGDVRDKAGCYRGLPSETIRAFSDAGLKLYNEAALITPVGTLALRAHGAFKARKLGKGHQNVLVFVKGDPRTAARETSPGALMDLSEIGEKKGFEGQPENV
jgi:hypothetical protein